MKEYTGSVHNGAYYKLSTDGTDSGPNGKNLSLQKYGAYNYPSFVSPGFFGSGNTLVTKNTAEPLASAMYFDIADNFSIGTGACTLAVWVKSNWTPPSPFVTSSKAYCDIIDLWGATLGGMFIWYCCPSGGNRQLQAYTMYSAYAHCEYATTLLEGEWYCIIATTTGASGILKLYTNGVLRAQANNSSAGTPPLSGNTLTRIACSNTTSFGSQTPPAYTWGGEMDEVIIDTVAWTDQNVADYYNYSISDTMLGVDF